MDPVSHAIFGLTLVSADRRARLWPAAGVMAAAGALSPDIDLLVAPFGWDRYLAVHEIGTHSILGALGCAAIAAALARAIAGGTYRQRAIAASVGALSHVALDVLSGATVRLLWPFADARFTAPLVAMADPWLAAVLVAGVVFGLIASTRQRVLVARMTLLAVAALLVTKTLLLRQAWEHYSAATTTRPSIAALAQAEWGSLTRWLICDRTAERVRQWRVDVSGGQVQPLLQIAIGDDIDAARRSMHLESVRHLRRAHDFVFATAEVVPGGTRVAWSDIRYCWHPDAARQVSAPLGSPQRPTPASVACSLWVGGTLDADGAPPRELIIVGTHVRERAE